MNCGLRPRKKRAGCTASRRLAAHRHGRATWNGVRADSGVLTKSRVLPRIGMAEPSRRMSDLLLPMLLTQKLTDLLLNIELLQKFIPRPHPFWFTTRLNINGHALPRLEFRPFR